MQHMVADIRVIKNTVSEIGTMISRQSSSLKCFAYLLMNNVGSGQAFPIMYTCADGQGSA